MNPQQQKAFIAVLAGAVCIAFAPILVRLSETGPVASGFWRMGLAYIVMLLWLLVGKGRSAWSDFSSLPMSTKKANPRRFIAWWAFVGTAFFFAGDLSTWHISLQYTTVTNSLLIVNSTVFVVALGAWAIYGEKPTRALIIGSLIGFGGVLTLILASATGKVAVPPPKSTDGYTLFGDLLSIVTLLFYAGYILQLRFARKHFGAKQLMLYSNAVCAIFLLVVSLSLGETILPSTVNGWLVLALLAIVCQVFGQTLIARGIEGLPLSFSSMVLLAQPVVGAIASAIILKEPITLSQVIGASLVFGGIYVARPQAKK